MCSMRPYSQSMKTIGGKNNPYTIRYSPCWLHICWDLLKALVNDGKPHILVDEVSMIPSQMWCLLGHIQKQYGFKIIGFGDFKQNNQ